MNKLFNKGSLIPLNPPRLKVRYFGGQAQKTGKNNVFVSFTVWPFFCAVFKFCPVLQGNTLAYSARQFMTLFGIMLAVKQ